MSELSNRFLKMFHNSRLDLYFTIRSEVRLENNSISHNWDFAIYRNVTPVMVVDIDGGYFHGDECDYDGLHSKEEYDEIRGQSVREGIMISVIPEHRFYEAFRITAMMLMMSYDRYVQYLHRLYLSMPFPTPSYTPRQLIKSYRQLVRFRDVDKYPNGLDSNIRFGDSLIKHFHPSIYDRSINNDLSPFKVWNNNRLLDGAIRRGIVYNTQLNTNKILQGFNVTKIGQRIPIFSSAKVKLLTMKYLRGCDDIIDPCCDLGNVLLGVTACHRSYIGVPISDVSFNENSNMIKFIQKFWNIDVQLNTRYFRFSGMFAILNNAELIDRCMSQYRCQKYLFITNETSKYKKHVVETIHSRSKSDPQEQYVILIERR